MRFSRYAQLHTTLYSLAGFQWPNEGPWSRSGLDFLVEMRKVVKKEQEGGFKTAFDESEPLPFLFVKNG